jgi:hypothetical protein
MVFKEWPFFLKKSQIRKRHFLFSKGKTFLIGFYCKNRPITFSITFTCPQLKPIRLGKEEGGVLKLASFGLTKKLTKQ